MYAEKTEQAKRNQQKQKNFDLSNFERKYEEFNKVSQNVDEQR